MPPTNQPILRKYPVIYVWPNEMFSTQEEFLVAHENADFITVNTESDEIIAEYVYATSHQ